MYKDVLKRLLASVLTVCMIGSSPNIMALAEEGIVETESETVYSPETFWGDGLGYEYEELKADDSYYEDKGHHYIANAYTIAEGDTNYDAQQITSVSFALDRGLIEDEKYVCTATYDISFYKYAEGADMAQVIEEGNCVNIEKISGSYAWNQCVGGSKASNNPEDRYFTVNIEDGPIFDKNEQIIVKVELNTTKWTLTAGGSDKLNKDIVYRSASLPLGVLSGSEIVSGTESYIPIESYADGACISDAKKAACIRVNAKDIQKVPITGIEISDASNYEYISELNTGENGILLSAVYEPENTTDKGMVWESADESVATVDANGFLEAKGLGKTEITVTSAVDGTVLYSMPVTVCRDISNLDVYEGENLVDGMAMSYQLFTGNQITPDVLVKDGETALERDTHYSVTYGENINVKPDATDDGTLTIKGITGNDLPENNYIGERNITFDIIYDIEECKVDVGELDESGNVIAPVYTGAELKPNLIVTDIKGNLLTPGVDYEIDETSWTNNIEACEDISNPDTAPKVIIRGLKDYTGEKEVLFEIKQKDLTDENVNVEILDLKNLDFQRLYTGEKIELTSEDISVEVDGNKISEYTINYKTGIYNTDVNYVGKVNFEIVGEGNYTGKAQGSFSIMKPLDGEDEEHNPWFTISVNEDNPIIYNGKAAEPSVVITDTITGETWEVDSDCKDFVIAGYSKNSVADNAGFAAPGQVTVEGKGYYGAFGTFTGKAVKDFTIEQGDLSKAKIDLLDEAESLVFTGEPIIPSLKVTYDGNLLTLDDGEDVDGDYIIEYKAGECTNATDGKLTAKVIIKPGSSASFENSKEYYFVIQEKSIEDEKITIEPGQVKAEDILAGKCPESLIVKDTSRLDGEGNAYKLVKDTDYKFVKWGMDEAGNYTIEIMGDGNYTGNKTCIVDDIVKVEVAEGALKAELNDGTVDSEEPAAMEVKYSGEAHMLDFDVYIGDTETELDEECYSVIVEKDGVVVDSCTDIGLYTFRILLKDTLYTGITTCAASGTFEIKPLSISDAKVEIDEQPYNDGNPVLPPENWITYNGYSLVENVDYVFVEGKGWNSKYFAGSLVSATIKGIGNFGADGDSERLVSFWIKGGTADKSIVIKGLESEYVYRSIPIEPDFTVTLGDETLIKGEHYTVTYENNENADSLVNKKNATVVIEPIPGKADFVPVEKTFKILRKFLKYESDIEIIVDGEAISNEENNLTILEKEFTGGPVSPTVEIKYYYPDANNADACYTLIPGTGTSKDYYTEMFHGANGYNATVNVAEKDLPSLSVRTNAVNFMGSATETNFTACRFKIEPKSINGDAPNSLRENMEIESISDMQFRKDIKEYEPEIVFYDHSRNAEGLPKASAEEISYAMRKGVDYMVSYENNVTPGIAKCVIEGKGNYKGSVTKEFRIIADISQATVYLDAQEYTYTGEAIQPVFKVGFSEREEDILPVTDYYLSRYEGDNKNVTEEGFRLVIKGRGNYTSQTEEDPILVSEPVLIKAKYISDEDVLKKNILPSYSYQDGRDVYPSPILSYNNMDLSEKENEEDTSYDFEGIKKGNCSAAGNTYTYVIKGNGNYQGTYNIEYAIGDTFTDENVKIELVEDIEEVELIYTGQNIEPPFRVVTKDGTETVLTPGVDYYFEYQNQVNAGKATIKASGITEQYAGDISFEYTIEQRDINDSRVTVETVTDKEYSRKEIMPEPIVTWTLDEETGARQLGKDEDIEYIYENNTDAGTAKVTIRGLEDGNFKNERTVEFEIYKKTIENSDVVIPEIAPQVYIGRKIRPKMDITWNGEALTKDVDYVLSYGDNTELGEGSVTVTGIGNYEGTVTKTFDIVKVNVEDLTVEYEDTWVYTGKEIKPAVSIYYGDVVLNNNLFTVEWSNTIESGLGSITITGNEYIEGTKNYSYIIKPRELSDSTIEFKYIPNQILDNTGVATPAPELIFRPNGYTTYTLVEGVDFEIRTYENNKAVGQVAKVIVRGLDGSNFTGEVSKDFYIGEDIKEYITGISFKEDFAYEYDGLTHMPEIDITLNPEADSNVDYEILYDGKRKEEIETLETDYYATKAGTHTVTLSGVKPFGGSYELTYEIAKRDISLVDFTIKPQVYTGEAIYPAIIGVDEKAKTRLGEANPVTGIIGDLDKEGMWSNGDAFTTEYQDDNVETGIVTVNIEATENSNYTGSTTTQFMIVGMDIEGVICGEIEGTQMYTGEPIVPDVVITDITRNAEGTTFEDGIDDTYYTLVKDVDYSVTCENNVLPGTATMTIVGIGNYEGKGTITRYFEIHADLSYAKIADIPAQEYTGEAVTPEPVVTIGELTLVKDVDYTVSYENNVNRGTATVIVTAVEGSLYTGSQTAEFEISRELTQDVSEIVLIDDLLDEKTSYVYTGAAITPRAAVLYKDEVLVEGTHYRLEYRNNVNPGTAMVVIHGIGSYSGTVTKEFTIVKRSVIRCTFENIISYVYTGAETKQNVIVKDNGRILVENQDYTVSYVNNVNPGTANVVITGIGNYGGTKTIRYLIHVKNMTEIAATVDAKSATISWSAVAGAQGYAVYNEKNDLVGRTTGLSYTHKNLQSMSTYGYKVRPYVVSDGIIYYGEFSNFVMVTTVPSKVKVKAKAQNGAVALSWKKIKGVSGYEIYRSTKKSGAYKKIKTIKKASLTRYTNKKLKSGKTYYYKVRAYKTINGVKVYGKYSSVRMAKTK